MRIVSNYRVIASLWISLVLVVTSFTQVVSDGIPPFITLPPKTVEFLNSTGGFLQCQSSPSDVKIQWLMKYDTPVVNVSGLRAVDADGKITFFPFLAEDFREDIHDTVYKCTATNTFGTVVSHDINVKAVIIRPYNVYVYDAYAIQGNTALMPCHIPSFLLSYVNVTAWMRDSVVVINSTQMDENSKYILMPSGELFIKNVEIKDGLKRFHCKTYNRLTGETVRSSSSGTLFVTESQSSIAPRIMQSEKKVSVERGQSAFLLCEVSAYPLATISWQRIDMNNTVMNNRGFQISGSFVLRNVELSDSGTYRCSATNQVGQDHIDIDLIVTESLSVTMDPDSITVNTGQPASIFCKPQGNPIMQLRWLKNGKPILLNSNIFLSNNYDTLHISTVSADDKGIYQCCAVNEHETTCGSSALLLRAMPPLTMLDIKVEIIDGNTCRIRWKFPHKDAWNGVIRGYNIGYRVNGSNVPYKFSALVVPEDYTEDLIYHITNLHKYTMYAIVIQVYNDKKVSPLTEPIFVMTPEDVPSQAPEGLQCAALSPKSIYVIWEQLPPETINGILIGYKVIYKPVSEWYDVKDQYKRTGATKMVLNRLDVNTNYSIVALAFTKVGDGTKTVPVYCKTLEDLPGPPSKIRVLPASGESIVVAWKPPNGNNGDIIEYNVYYETFSESREIDSQLKSEQSNTNNVHSFQTEMKYFKINGLRKNQRYAFWVSATSDIGEGQQSDIIVQSVADSTIAATAVSFDDVINTPRNRTIMLPCRAVGIPPPQRKWSIGNKSVQIDGRKVLLPDGTLFINKVDSNDSGNYTCTIYNIYGKDEVKYYLNIQIPPGSPILNVTSKTRSSIKLQWKLTSDDNDPIKGYILHYKQDSSDWESITLNHDKQIFTLSNLSCGTNYQIYMEAFNKIGKGLPCDIIKTSTEGSELSIPTKEQLLLEDSTFILVHLELWPVTVCTVQSFQVEYKLFHSDEWTVVSNSISPIQKKLVIPGLIPATWYNLRITANTNGYAVIVEYKFATLNNNCERIVPLEIRMENQQSPIYIFYLDLYIFIPAVCFVVIIISAVICICIKRKSRSESTSPDYGGKFDISQNSTKAFLSYPGSNRKCNSNYPNPYASGPADYFPDCDA